MNEKVSSAMQGEHAAPCGGPDASRVRASGEDNRSRGPAAATRLSRWMSLLQGERWIWTLEK